MTDHTPTPWMAASKYSSMVGVPIVNQQGKRIGNTALPDMPHEWDHLKRQAEVDAAFIIKAVTNHGALVKALQLARARIEYLGVAHPNSKHFEANEKTFLPAIDEVLSVVGSAPTPSAPAASTPVRRPRE
jgi:hypothetical protein